MAGLKVFMARIRTVDKRCKFFSKKCKSFVRGLINF